MEKLNQEEMQAVSGGFTLNVSPTLNLNLNNIVQNGFVLVAGNIGTGPIFTGLAQFIHL